MGFTIEQKWQKKKNLVKKQALENKKSPVVNINELMLHPFRRIEICNVFKMYTNSLVTTDLFYANFTKTTFQNIPIPHLTPTMKQRVLH